MSDVKGSADQAIGRPGPWQEGRYQQPGKPVDPSVTAPNDKAHNQPRADDVPVTRQDYEQK